MPPPTSCAGGCVDMRQKQSQTSVFRVIESTDDDVRAYINLPKPAA